MVTLGCLTLLVFLSRFALFSFQESPKYLLAKGHDAHALDVLYHIAHFNDVSPPDLTMDDFEALDFGETQIAQEMRLGAGKMLGNALQQAFGHLKGLFKDRMYAWLFVSLAIA
jgi:hypothetical protein